MRAALGAVTIAALIASSSMANAAPKPQIRDATGDYPVASADIVSGTLSVSGKSKKKSLTIRLTLAAALVTTTPYTYSVNFKAEDCQFSAIYYGHPFIGVFSASGVGCHDGSTSLPEGDVVVEGSTAVWKVPLVSPLKVKQTVKTLRAKTESSGVASNFMSAPLADDAAGTGWVIG